MLDKQLQIRSATMAELGNVREQSLQRICDAVESQNVQARTRNQELREYIYRTSSQTHTSHKPDPHLSANKLKEAKEQYLKHVEATLPIWHRYQTVQLEENVRNIQLEKAQSFKRREQLQAELMKENTVKQQLERHRQELIYSLAAEQRIILESQANAILLEEESRAANAQVAHELSLSAYEMNELVNTNVYKMRQATQQLASMLPQPSITTMKQPLERNNDDVNTKLSSFRQPASFPQAVEVSHQPQKTESKQVFVPEEQDYTSASLNRRRHGSLVLSAVTETEETPQDTELVLSPTASSAYNPRSRSSSLSHQITPAKHHINQSQFNNTMVASPLTNASQLLMQTQLDPDMTFTTAFTANDSEIDHSQQLNESYGSTHKGEKNAEGTTHQRLFGSVLDTHHEGLNEHDNSPNGEAAHQSQAEFTSFLMPPQQQPETPNALRTPSSSKKDSFFDPSSYESSSFKSNQGNNNIASPAVSPRASLTVPIEVRAGSSRHSSPLGGSVSAKGAFFGADDAEPTAQNVSRMNSTTFSETGSAKNQQVGDIATLVEGLSIPQCTALLLAVCREIERRATEGAAPVSVTTVYDTQSRHRAVHIIDAFNTSGGADNSNFSAVLNNAADSTLGNAVLSIVEGKSGILIPRY